MAYNMPPFEQIIGGGISGVVYALDSRVVLKVASGFNYSHQDLAIECRIYERLRSGQPQILNFSLEPRGLLFEKLVCPLRSYLRHLHGKRKIEKDGRLLRWAGQIVNGLWFIHSKGVLQANIGCHNLLLDRKGNLKFCDFGGASIDGGEPTVDYEPRSRHPIIRGPNVATELFALGTTLYEMSMTEPPYPEVDDDEEIQSRYTFGMFPDVDHLVLGEIISGCWQGSYDSTLDIAVDMEIISASSTSGFSMSSEFGMSSKSSMSSMSSPASLSTLFPCSR